MRADQYDKLKKITEELLDVAAIELDAEHWPGGEKKPDKLSKDERGDRYWCKKNAAATLTLLTKLATLIGIEERRWITDDPPPENPNAEGRDEETDLEQEIASAEREAAKIIDRIRARQPAPASGKAKRRAR